MNTIIETERLILRAFEDSDDEAVFAFNSNLEVTRYTGEKQIKDISEAQSIITKIKNVDYAVHGYGRFAVVYKPHNKVIGFSGLKWEADISETDIGYRFLPEYWGKGIATESCLPLLQYGFKELGLERIVGLAYPKNIASCRVLQKIGMQHYKTDYFPGDSIQCNWYKIQNPSSIPIIVSQSIKCTKEKVWSAITSLEEMKQWYFKELKAFVPKIGFTTEFTIHNEGKTFTHLWKIVEVKDYLSITYSWKYLEYSGNSRSTFILTTTEQGTEITVSCIGLETFQNVTPEFTTESCKAGWNYFLNRLKEYCEK